MIQSITSFADQEGSHLSTKSTKTEYPLVSIIVPVYNGSRYICTALNSIIEQTYKNYEIIVVDDGSTDDTKNKLSYYSDIIRYVYQTNQGSAAARNLGLSIAKGELIAFLDADDYWLKTDKLTKQVECFLQDSTLGCVNTGWKIVDAYNKHIKTVQPWHKAPNLNLETWLKKKCVRTSAMMFRREWLEKVGGFDQNLRQSHDVDLILRLALAGCQTQWLKEETVCYRQHENNTTRNNLRQAECVQKVLNKFFANQDLPDNIRAIESDTKYHTLVWLAWYQYRASDLDKMLELLQKSLDISPYLRVENIAHWLTSFEKYSRDKGEHFDPVLLTKSYQWQQLISQTLEIDAIAPSHNDVATKIQERETTSSPQYVEESQNFLLCKEHEQRGDIFAAQQNWHQACISYVGALKAKPDRFPVYEKIAQILAEQDKPIVPEVNSTTPSTYAYLPQEFLVEYCGLSADDYTNPYLDPTIKYISVQPRNRVTFNASKTLPDRTIPPFVKTQTINVAPAFVAVIPEGRAWADKAVSGVITQQNKIVADTHSGCFGFVLKSTDLPEPKYIDGTVAFLSVRWGQRGYFHWMFDILTRIEIIKSSGIDLESIDYFVVNKFEQDFHLETFQHLGIPKDKIIESLEIPHIKAKSLIVPSLPHLRAYRDAQWACQALRDNFLTQTKNPKYERVYVNRSEVAHRKVLNENRVISYLESLGFKSVAFESMSFKEQVSCMASAKVVVAVHGAGLSNLVFCAPGTKVIEIFSPAHQQNTYWRISNLCQLEHYFLFSDEVSDAQNTQQRSVKKDVTVNLNDLNRLLQNLNLENSLSIEEDSIEIETLPTVNSSEEHQKLITYHQNLEQEPKNIEHYLNLGNALVKQNKPEAAIAFYKIGLQIQPNEPRLQQQLGRVSPQDSLIIKQYRREIESIKPEDVKITFATIMLNEEEYIGKNLEQHYPLCDEWILVEGTCLGYPTERVTPDGLSKDRTAEIIRNFPDPENKIRFIQHGWTKATGEDAKSEMRNRYAELADTGILVVIDADEFYRRNHLKRVLDDMTHKKYNSWRLPQMHLWKNDHQVIKGGYYDVGHNRIYSWHKNLRYISNHNHPETECGHLWHESGEYIKNPRKFIKQDGGYDHPGLCCFHYGFAKSEENMRDKTNYYIGRGEDTTRPQTTACRTGWFENKVPDGCQVLPWRGRLPEVFEAVWSHYYV